MIINSIIECDGGLVKFEGTLTQEDAALLISAGLNYLYKLGLLAHILPSLSSTSNLENMEIDTPSQ